MFGMVTASRPVARRCEAFRSRDTPRRCALSTFGCSRVGRWAIRSSPPTTPSMPEPMMAASGAHEHRVFAGNLDKKKLSLEERGPSFEPYTLSMVTSANGTRSTTRQSVRPETLRPSLADGDQEPAGVVLAVEHRVDRCLCQRLVVGSVARRDRDAQAVTLRNRVGDVPDVDPVLKWLPRGNDRRAPSFGSHGAPGRDFFASRAGVRPRT